MALTTKQLLDVIFGANPPAAEQIARIHQLCPGFDGQPLDETVRQTLAARDKTIDDLRRQLAQVPTSPPPVSEKFQLIFHEDFERNCAEGEFLHTYADTFTAYPKGWQDTSKKGHYNPDIISVNNGIMNMRIHTDASGAPQVAAPQPLINGPHGDVNQLYGRYEVRFRADEGAGYKTAWLLWPRTEVWPRDGEIDFPEGDLTGSIGAFMHRQGGASGADQDGYQTRARYSDWHVAVIEWQPNRCAFFLDDQLVGLSTRAVPNTPMRWVLQTETELNSTYPARDVVANVQVDYVKVWRYAP